MNSMNKMGSDADRSSNFLDGVDMNQHANTSNIIDFQFAQPTAALKDETGFDANADSFEYIGDNIIAKGNAFVRKGELLLYADKVIINNVSKNIELAGNVRFFNLTKSRSEIEYWDLQKLENDPYVKLKVVGTVMTPTGRQKLIVDTIRENLSWTGERAAGNLQTGVFEFGNFVSKFGNWFVLGDKGRRYADGKIIMKDSVTSQCPSIAEGHSVFSLKSGKIVAYPPVNNYEMQPGNSSQKLSNYDGQNDLNGYSFWAYNNLLYIGEVPVLWFPVFYKPPKGEMGKWNVKAGSNSDWGYYLQTTNSWQIMDDPNLSITNMVDLYSKRGLALGNQAEMYTTNTATESFIYGLYDLEPNQNVPVTSRVGDLGHFRYTIDVKNVSHITDRLDFRGRFAKLSDMYFLYDFFDNQASVDPQPPTFVDLGYQFDRFSLNLTYHPKVNKFFSVVEELPKLELSIPRQEVWENFYYQGSMSLASYNVDWAEYKQSWEDLRGVTYNGQTVPVNAVDPGNYHAMRWDTVNFMYYPINLDWMNIIPRAGLRLTAYSNSSQQKVSDIDLFSMMNNAAVQSRYSSPYTSGSNNNYDSKGGAKFRVIPEFGIEANTKFSQSWDQVKNAYFDIDGLRHIIQPYINYTYIMDPTVSRDELFYFDDVDRIDKQNFIRLGLNNRLQTRRGNWNSSQVYTWASMENFVDILIDPQEHDYSPNNLNGNDGLRHLGDIGTIINIDPSENLNFSLEILIDGSQLGSSSGLSDAIDKLSVSADWDFAENWGINASWYYGNDNYSQGQYSMGSSLLEVQSGSVFQRIFTKSSYFNGSLDFQINERTAGSLNFSYDFNQNLMPGLGLQLIRALPCGLELMVNAGVSKQNNNSGTGTQLKTNLSGSLGFSSSPNYAVSPRQDLLPSELQRVPNSY